MSQADAINPAGAVAYATPNRELIGRLVLESRSAPSTGAIIASLHSALMSEGTSLFISQAALYAVHEAKNRDIGMALLAFLYAKARSFQGETRQAWFNAASETLRATMLDLSHLRSFLSYYRGPSQRSGARWGYEGTIGGRLQKDLKRWINEHPIEKLIKGRAGAAPTIQDIFRMVHPGSDDPVRNNVYRWLVRGDYQEPNHPLVTDIDALQHGNIPEEGSPIWRLPLDFLGPFIGDTPTAWVHIARNTRIRQLLKNLNTFARQLVYADNQDVVAQHVSMLCDSDVVQNARVTAYEVFRASQALDPSVPSAIKDALEVTLHSSFGNIARTEAPIVVLIDTSGSMQQPLGRVRGKATALRRCDAAALLASALTQAGENVLLVPFDTRIRSINQLQSARGVMGIANAIAAFMGGGTNAAVAFNWLNENFDSTFPGATGPANVVFISDNESLPQFGLRHGFSHVVATRAQEEWLRFTQNREGSRLLLMDVAVDGTQQIESSTGDVTGLSGLNPATFNLLSKWIEGSTPSEEAAPQVDIVNEILNFSLDQPGAPE